ncbi:hypothetical protein ACS0TY_019345 [Phlomoides rotata]
MWTVIAEDVVGVVQYFFRHSYIPFGLNSNFVVLIRRWMVLSVLRIFDPLCWETSCSRFFTKILATRLGPIIAKLLSPHQFGFIPGKSIHNCILYASKGINCLDKTSVQRNVAFKVDIQKAFDTVSWDFLLVVLEAFGFDARFTRMVKVILTSARLSILFNGSPHGYFGCTRGVRQGDPLSPLLFCIAEDVLARLIDRVVYHRYFHPAFALNRFCCPTYLLYAGDVLVFCKASRGNARCLKRILDIYVGLSGQVFNPDKSKAYFGKHVSSLNKADFRATLNICYAALPFTYLGVPLFRGDPKAAHLRSTTDRIISKFVGWKGSSLSLAGRACLINSVIVSSLVHSMMIYRWPRSLLNKVDKPMRNFLWTGSTEKIGFCTVNWTKVCAP